jgi:hypothetical protein
MYGTAGHATNIGVKVGSGSRTNGISGPLVKGNTIDQWHIALQSYGVAVRQTANYFEGNNSVLMGGNYAISNITQAAQAVVTSSAPQATNPFAIENFAISGITNAASAVVTLSSPAAVNPVSVNGVLSFSGVGGMVQINGLAGTVTAIGGVSGAWTATVNINSGAFGAYTAGGTAASGAIGNAVNFSGVGGMVEINGLQGVISAIGGIPGAWLVTVNINSTAFTAYGAGGTVATAQNFNWVRGLGMANIQNCSVNDIVVDGTVNFPTNGIDGCMFVGPGTCYFDTAVLNGNVGFKEYGRTQKLGDWVDFAATLSASGAMTWGGGAAPTLRYSINGHTMTIAYVLTGTAVGGVVGTELRIALPTGFAVAKQMQQTNILTNNAVSAFGFASVDPGQAYIRLFRDSTGATNWTAGATNVSGEITFAIN